MSQDNGKFSKSFIGLQLQFKTLLEEVGGDDLMSCLNLLAELTPSERENIIQQFKALLSENLKKPRVETAGDLALKNAEQELFDGIVSDISQLKQSGKPVVSIIKGGKSDQKTICLSSAKKRRKNLENLSLV